MRCNNCKYYIESGYINHPDDHREGGYADDSYGSCHANPPIQFGAQWIRPRVYETDDACRFYDDDTDFEWRALPDDERDTEEDI